MKRIFSANKIQLLVIACLIVLVTFSANASTTSNGNAFVVTGKVTNYDKTNAEDGLKVIVSNETRASLASEETTVGKTKSGEYRVTFMDIDTETGTVAVVADVGDTFKVVVKDGDNSIATGSYQITQTDIDNAMSIINVQIPPTGMQISPGGPLRININDTQQFSITVEDYRGTHETEATDVTWEVIGGIGTIDENGLFTATTAGTGSVKATLKTYPDITAQAQIGGFGIISEITAPTNGQYVKGTLQIKGKAKVIGGTFVRWQLYYASGNPIIPQSLTPLAAGTWQPLKESEESVDGGLLFEWDTTTINQVDIQGDQYSLYLRVTGKDSEEVTHYKSSSKITFWIDNIKPEPPVLDVTSKPDPNPFNLSDNHDYTTNYAILTVVGSVNEGSKEGSDDDLIIESVTCPGMTSHNIEIHDTTISGTIKLGEVTGSIRVSVVVKDKAGSVSDPGKSNPLQSDNNLPSVTIQQPANNANFGANSFTISGVASDSLSGVAKVQIYIVGDKPNGKENWEECEGTTNWETVYDPSHQYPHTFDSDSTCRVRAIDTVGNVSEISEIFVRYYSYKPLINLSSPIDGEYLTGTVEIRGSASAAYTLTYENEDNPDDNGEIAGFDPPITNGVIAQWNTSGLKKDKKYTLHLKIGEEEVKRVHLIGGTPLWGDVNDDKVVDAKDATEVLQYVVGLSPAGFIAERADVSGNGKITAYDGALILQKLAGLIDKFPVEQ